MYIHSPCAAYSVHPTNYETTTPTPTAVTRDGLAHSRSLSTARRARRVA